eukprot:jgi/Psemu1/302058/fgenesh1_kg.56_\
MINTVKETGRLIEQSGRTVGSHDEMLITIGTDSKESFVYTHASKEFDVFLQM